MTISSQKELAKLIVLCRKHQIDEIEIDNIRIKLGRKDSRPAKIGIPLKDLPHQQYTTEDVLNWSSTALDGAFDG